MLKSITGGLKEVELLDAMCGTGKTHNLFKFVALNPDEHYVYVTPMLSEVSSRATEELAKFPECGVVFDEATGDGYRTKGDHLLDLLAMGKNVICTHALFLGVSCGGRSSIAKHRYVIIMDEELGMIEALRDDVLAREDKKALIAENVIVTQHDGRVVWNREAWGDGDSAFSRVRKMADDGSLYSTQCGTLLNVQVPVELLSSAKRVIIATYLFQGSVLQAFLKVKGIGHKEFTFDGLALRDAALLKAALRERVEMYDCSATSDKLLRTLKVPVDDLVAKRGDGAFSANWYASAKKDRVTLLGNHVRNVARQMAATAENLMYTLPSNIAGKRGDKWVSSGPKVVKVKGYSPRKCFLHKGARATNDYAHKTSAIHLYNRYANPVLTRYLSEHGAEVDQDNFALAELIQWFFRTAIRIPNGPKVKLHILSPRMNDLFKRWLDS